MNEQMMTIKLPLSALTVVAAATMAFARRRHEKSTDLLMACQSLDPDLLSADRSDPLSTLEDYLLALLCSGHPSQFRALDRPSHLLSTPTPPLVGAPSYLRRAWSTDVVGVHKKKTPSDLKDPDSSQDGARLRWVNLVRQWRLNRQDRFTADIGSKHSRRIVIGTWERNYAVLTTRFNDEDAAILLQSAEPVLLGLPSYRRLEWGTEDDIATEQSKQQQLLEAVSSFLEWNSYNGQVLGALLARDDASSSSLATPASCARNISRLEPATPLITG